MENYLLGLCLVLASCFHARTVPPEGELLGTWELEGVEIRGPLDILEIQFVDSSLCYFGGIQDTIYFASYKYEEDSLIFDWGGQRYTSDIILKEKDSMVLASLLYIDRRLTYKRVSK